MKTINTTNRIQRVTKLIATGALVAAPFLSVLPSAEAQPRWNQGRNNNNNTWGRSVTTFEGTVTRDLYGDAFDVRTDNGRIVQVHLKGYDEPRSLDRGDYVRVTGQTRNGVFVASNIQFIRDTGNGNWNGNNNGNSQNSITGVVTRDLAGKSFELRTDNGRTVHVSFGRNDEPRSLDRGDRVRVAGRYEGSIFRATDVQFLSDTSNNNGGWGNNQQTTTLSGVVTRDLSGDSFELRTDTGRTVSVRLSRVDEPRSLDRGDRVRVTGRYNGNSSTFRATDVQFIRDTGNGSNNGGWGNNQQTTTLTGVVTRDFSGDNFELRTDAGRTVSVRVARGDEPRSLDRGDRVRVTGRYTNNTFIARDLDILRDTRR